MNKYLAAFIAAAVAAFASCALTWQCGHSVARQNEQYSSLAQSFLRGQKLAGVSNIMARSQEYVTAAGTLGYYDLILPENARVFMTDMTGPANYHKIGYYYFITYYLFPREIGVSVDQPTRIGATGFSGSTTGSDQELLARGYDVRIDVSSGDQLHIKALRDLPMRFPKNPPGFDSNYDTMIAFLLPLLTALTGMWLLRFLFSALAEQMPVLEQLACGLGLGMMAVAALTFGVKLCGFHGHGLSLVITAAGAVAELWRDRKVIVTRAIESSRKTVRSPVTAVFVIIGLLVFLILFRIAGLEGLVDPDAAMAWSVKTKIVHLYAGNDLVRWFSAPGLSRAHLDYPTLVPSLHSATYD